MATTLGTVRTRVRTQLVEATAKYWTDDELLAHLIEGCKDLWGAVVDVHREHFLTIDESNVSMEANTATLTGVPADTFRVYLIEPRDTTPTATGANTIFRPKDYNHQEFISARARENADPGSAPTILYNLRGAGAPVAAPSIDVAPKLTSALTLRFVYIPTLGTLTAASNNPIPGESDNALFAWCYAYARAKERDDKMPDPAWLAVYATEKQAVLTRITPRQEQEVEVVDDLFGFNY